MHLRLEVTALLCVCVAGIAAVPVPGGNPNPALAHQLEDSAVQASRPWRVPRGGRWQAVLVPASAALLLVLVVGLCAGRKQQLNINDDGEPEEASGGILSCCQPKVLNKEPSILPQDSYAVRGPSTQNLVSAEPVLLSPNKSGNASSSNHHPSASAGVAHGTPPELRSPAIEESDDHDESQPSPPSFLGKTFASFNILHSKWRNKAPPGGEHQNKSLSRSLENLPGATTAAAASSSGGDSRPARSALKPALVPPPVQWRPRTASKAADASPEAAEAAAPSGYEPVVVRPSARERQRSSARDDKQGADLPPAKVDAPSKGAAQPLAGMLRRLKKPRSTSSSRKGGEENEGSASGDGGAADKIGHQAVDGEESRTQRTVTVHPAPCELAYNQVTVQAKPDAGQEVVKQRRPDQAYAISGPLKTQPSKAKPPPEMASSAAQPTAAAASSTSPPSPVHRRLRSQAKKSPKPGRELRESASARTSIPSSDYEPIIPGMMPPGRNGQSDPPAKKEPVSAPNRDVKRFHNGGAEKAALEDPDHDYDEPEECASKKAAKKQKQPPGPRDVYSVVDKNPAAKHKDVHGAGDKSKAVVAATSPPAPTDMYSVVDKKQKQQPPPQHAPAPTDLYSVVDKKQPPPQHAPAPTELYSSIDKRQPNDDKLVYTLLAFQPEQAEMAPTSPPAKKAALPAPATVYEQIDLDVHADAAKLPQRTTAGLREDDSDYEDIEGATKPIKPPRPGK